MLCRLSLLSLVAVTLSCALVAGSIDNEWDLDAPMPGRLMKELKLEPTAISRDALGTLDRSVQARISAVVLPRGDDGCCKCVGETAHHIIDETYKSVQTACANVTCPVIKKECEWIESHEDRYKGFLIARIRPASLGFSYCMGTGECHHPNYTRISEIASDKTDPAYMALQVESLVGEVVSATMANRTAEWKAEQQRRFGDNDGDEQQHQTSEVTTGADAKEDRRHRCLRKAVKWVMKHAIKAFIHHCKHTSCPYEQKVCEWANKHRDLTHGYIYGRVEPWKMALGYCAGKRHCKAGLAQA